jgi:hypothetical protein
MPGPADPKWLPEAVPLDSQLQDALDIRAPRATRRVVAIGLMRAMKFEVPPERSVADSTLRVFYNMTDAIVSMRNAGHYSIHEAGDQIVRGQGRHAFARADSDDARQAMIDLGWACAAIGAESDREMLNEIRSKYVENMTVRLVTLLRRWDTKGWLRAAT